MTPRRLTALLTIGRAELLPLLFGRVLIPPAVRQELLREHPILPAWLEVVTPTIIPPAVINAKLDAGETQSIALAVELRVETVLMDERLGRRVAQSLGLRTTGVLGCLVLAKRDGHLPAISTVIAELQSMAGCWFDEELIAAVLRAAGET